MADKPILFNGDMVRAILAVRKTQTRRPVLVPWHGRKKTAPWEPYYIDVDGRLLCMDEAGQYHEASEWLHSPFGAPGDRLYVRETFQRRADFDGRRYLYRADIDHCGQCPVRAGKGYPNPEGTVMLTPKGPWTPSIHMPRAAARIWLKVERVWAERVQDISEEDARAEGFGGNGHTPGSLRDGFASEWENIYSRKGLGWEDNPWVWCCEFSVLSVTGEPK